MVLTKITIIPIQMLSTDSILFYLKISGLHGPYLQIDQHLSIKDDYRVEFTAALQNSSEIEKI